MKSKTLVILSGGMDSTVLAHHTRSQLNTELVGCVSINYGQRHVKELECAAKTCACLSVPHHLIQFPTLGAALSHSVLTGSGDIPDGHYAAETMKATVVPNRNMILMAIAAGVAINQGAGIIAYGAHAGDHAIYPDCRVAFADAMHDALWLCHEPGIRLTRPFIDWDKSAIVRRGAQLGVPFEDTWTCYRGEGIHCGRCGTCVERLEAFDKAGVRDPVPYSDLDSWRTILAGESTQEKLKL